MNQSTRKHLLYAISDKKTDFHNVQFHIIILAKGAGVLCEGGQGQKKPFNLIFLSSNLFSDSSTPVIANAVLQASLPNIITTRLIGEREKRKIYLYVMVQFVGTAYRRKIC